MSQLFVLEIVLNYITQNNNIRTSNYQYISNKSYLKQIKTYNDQQQRGSFFNNVSRKPPLLSIFNNYNSISSVKS